jgi:DNA-binding CsgD family transcriptional regulator
LRERAAAGERKSLLAKEFGISRETVYSYLRTVSADLRAATVTG